ncbi:MAG TPA: hypothetical protein VGK45_18835 [Thermoanaerobaculia bacterium]|jgi:hypothetical protein
MSTPACDSQTAVVERMVQKVADQVVQALCGDLEFTFNEPRRNVRRMVEDAVRPLANFAAQKERAAENAGQRAECAETREEALREVVAEVVRALSRGTGRELLDSTRQEMEPLRIQALAALAATEPEGGVR